MKPTARLLTNGGEVFDQLPLILRNFFQKYLPASHVKYSDKPGLTTDADANPFLPNKHPITNKYHTAKYSLRRQSVLFKTAKRYGIEDLLPGLNKQFYEDKYNSKKFMKGVLRPKGHKHELAKDAKDEKVQKSMAAMNDKILAVKGSKFKKRLEAKKNEKSFY